MSNTNHFFNSIKLSSVNPVIEGNKSHNDSLIHQLDLLQSQIHIPHKIQSFIYAQQFKSQAEQLRDTPISKKNIYSKYNHYQQQQHLNCVESQIDSGKKSVRQQIMDQNKQLQQKLNQRLKSTVYAPRKKELGGRDDFFKPQNNSKPNRTFLPEKQTGFYEKQQEQYNNSNLIRLYNFILRQIPQCQQCKQKKDQIIRSTKGIEYSCQKCKTLERGYYFQSLMGVLYDLENKGRFEQELACYQSCLDNVNKEINELKSQLAKLQKLKDQILNLKTLSRKKFKQITEAKFYLKKNIGNFTGQHFQYLKTIIPDQYIQQMGLWREVCQLRYGKYSAIDEKIFKIIPLYLYDFTNSKVLSTLHKILNYKNSQQMKISVSEPIRFPIKRMQKMVLVVDGSYSLPVFDEIGHLHLEFQHKKTKRQLSLLFSSFPRTLDSLSFSFNHKLHSHISAQNFPFLQYLSPFHTIRHLQITIDNAKQLGDILKLPHIMTPKRELKLTITKHLFSQQQLILPHDFYNKLLIKLGPQLLKLQISLPENVDSQAIVSYEKYITLNKLLKFKIRREEKENPGLKNRKILDQAGDSRRFIQRLQGNVFQRLIKSRIRLVVLARKFGSLQGNLFQSIISVL